MNKEIQVEHLGDPKMGMLIYRNMLGRDMNLVERLENTIGESNEAPFMWMDALVGDSVKMPEYRDCVDCKIGDGYMEHLPEKFSELRNIYNDTVEKLTACLDHYQSVYNINMQYREAINYVRYKPGQHFQIHSDDGFSYNCTVSSVMYLNDEYEGGELWFPYLDLTLKPSYGDIVLFPSTFIYAHASKKVVSGTKYAAVTMFDWNDRTHQIPGQQYA
jgi:hypothetical protein